MNGLRVAIIDNDNLFKDVVKGLLEDDSHFQVVSSMSSEIEAIEWINEEGHNKVDGIILDLNLPYYMDDKHTNPRAGLRILRRLREEARFFGTVVILTNSRDLDDGKDALDQGCDGYLCKDMEMESIYNLITELKLALEGRVLMISNEMRFAFLRDSISAREAQLMEMLRDGKSWSEIARAMEYSSSKAAANIGDRIFDKILSETDKFKRKSQGLKKREVALEVWSERHRVRH
ncbi:MAG: response regulator [Cyanobacteriota/Melainabacteria group bacterium]